MESIFIAIWGGRLNDILGLRLAVLLVIGKDSFAVKLPAMAKPIYFCWRKYFRGIEKKKAHNFIRGLSTGRYDSLGS